LKHQRCNFAVCVCICSSISTAKDDRQTTAELSSLEQLLLSVQNTDYSNGKRFASKLKCVWIRESKQNSS